MPTVSPPPRGLALVELVVALVLTAVLAEAVYSVLLGSQRFYRAQAAVLEVHRGMRAAAQVLTAELRELDPAGGDVVALAPDSISIHASRRFAIVCAPPDPASGRIVVADALSFGFRAVDPARDRALVFREGDPTTADDDAWLDLAVASATDGGAACADGAPGSAWVLAGATAGLADVTVGSPVRTYERAVYRLYADGEGVWWLGVRTWSDGAWAAVSPVAGPLAPAAGLVFGYEDRHGSVTDDPRRIAGITIAVRGVSEEQLQAAGGRQGRFVDSLVISVVPRNGRREVPP